MSDRKAELERKKAKLQAMREEKKRKEEDRRRRETGKAATQEGDKPSQLQDFSRNFGLKIGKEDVVTRPTDLRSETDKMLQDLGIPPAVSPQSTASSTTPASAENVASPQETGPTQAATTRAKKISLGVSKVTQTNIAPRELVAYNKETQTPAEALEREARAWDYYEGSTASNSPFGGSPNLSSHGSGKFMYPHMEWDDEFSSQEALQPNERVIGASENGKDDDNDSFEVGVDTPPISGHAKLPPLDLRPQKPAPEEAPVPKQEEKPKPVRDLTDEERNQIMNTEEFGRFFERTTRIMERALNENLDIFTDYSGTDAEDMEGGLAEGERLKLNRTFFDDRWSRHRTVTCMDWSVQYPELLVASYNCNEDAPHEPDGVALIWNMKFKKDTPEYIFHCQSSVMSTCFAKFHPNLIIGGTYSGQIVLWDNRSNKRTPVQRTPLSAAAHTHPVYCVNVVGTQNAHNLISVSTDGKMCSWSLDMLSQPQDSMELQHKQSKAVAVTSFSFLSSDVNNFVVGSEEGAVYTACRHGSKAGISDMFEGHQGPVTGIDCNTVPGQVDFSHYFITSSFDWTIKLWNIKESKPLYSFEDNSEYVYDTKWSPIHPSLFAAVDGAGRLDLWNLNNDTEVPTASVVVDNQVALNRCRWHQNGREIAAGDDIGRIHVYDVGEPVATPRNDEWSRFVHTLSELKTQQAEDEDSGNISLSASPLR